MKGLFSDDTVSTDLTLRQSIADNAFAKRADEVTFMCAAEVFSKMQPTPCNDLSEELVHDLEIIEVESVGYKAALDIIPKDDAQAKKLKAIIDRGPTYTTMRCFLKKGV